MPPVMRSQADDAQRANYLEAATETKTGLRAALTTLRSRQSHSGDPAELAQIRVGILDVESELARVQADMLAFLAESRAVTPPSAAQLAAIKDTVRAIDRMTAQSVLASTVLDASTALLTQWRQTV